MKENQTKYWANVRITVSTLIEGIKVTTGHFWNARKQRNAIGVESDNYFEKNNGLQTVLYPHEELPIPDNGRYQLHNEIDDCIVCDKCVKVCPVDCIDIEPIRAVEDLGKTSDGTPKRIHAAKFDINMSKCCFCGLCTTVCPTECLTMTNEFDFSEFEVKKHNFEFATLTSSEVSEKKEALEKFNLEKQEASKLISIDKKKASPKIKMKPIIKKTIPEENAEQGKTNVTKPKFRPRPVMKKKKEE